MANTYKSAASKLNSLTGTTSASLYTTPTNVSASLVKNLYIANVTTNSLVSVDVYLNKSGSAIKYYLITSASIPVYTTFQPVVDPIVLQSGDSVWASTVSASFDTIMSYLEIT